MTALTCYYVTHLDWWSSLADPGGAAGMPPPPTGSISFVFAYVFMEKCMHQRSVPLLWVSAPPMGNPGSATGAPGGQMSSVYVITMPNLCLGLLFHHNLCNVHFYK